MFGFWDFCVACVTAWAIVALAVVICTTIDNRQRKRPG